MRLIMVIYTALTVENIYKKASLGPLMNNFGNDDIILVGLNWNKPAILIQFPWVFDKAPDSSELFNMI